MATTTGNTRLRNNALTAIPGDYINVYYNDADTGDGTAAQSSGSTTVRQNYTQVTYAPSYPRFTFNPEQRVFGFATADNATRVELPFDFPFYGQKYRRAWISTDGIISFTRPEPFNLPCPSHS